jgi:hypothetical protein
MSDPSVNDYKITFEMCPDYLYVRVTLTRNEYNIARQYWTDVLRMIHKQRSTSAIVEISAKAALPPVDAHALMADFSRFLYPGVKVAIVNRHVIPNVRAAVQSAATIRDRSIKVFDDLSTAKEWLGEPSYNFAPAALKSDVHDLTNRDTLQ